MLERVDRTDDVNGVHLAAATLPLHGAFRQNFSAYNFKFTRKSLKMLEFLPKSTGIRLVRVELVKLPKEAI